MFAGTQGLLLYPGVMGWWSGQGWQSHRPGRESAGCTCSWLCSKKEPQALFPAPHSLIPRLLKQQEADCQQEHSELSATGTGRLLFPQLPKGSSTATRPTLSSGKGLPSSLSFILWACAGCQRSRQLLLPSCPGRLGMLNYPASRMFYARWEQSLAQPCRASPGPAEHIKQNKHPEKQG